MVEGASTGPNLHALGLLDGKQVTDEIKVNQDESPQIIMAGLDKAYFTGIKLLSAIPLIGSLLASVIPANPGKVSGVSGLESGGLASSQILPGNRGAQGGVLGKIAGEIMSNSAITDHTAGVGGSASGEGGGGGGGEASAGGGGGGDYSMLSSNGFSDMAGAHSFDWSPISMASLGTFSRPDVPDMSSGRGADYGLSA